MTVTDNDIKDFVEILDPDWQEHFLSVDQAFDYYRENAATDVLEGAAREWEEARNGTR